MHILSNCDFKAFFSQYDVHEWINGKFISGNYNYTGCSEHRLEWTFTHTSHKDTKQSTIEASVTFDGITLTDALSR
jgi:hypothetical protein